MALKKVSSTSKYGVTVVFKNSEDADSKQENDHQNEPSCGDQNEEANHLDSFADSSNCSEKTTVSPRNTETDVNDHESASHETAQNSSESSSSIENTEKSEEIVISSMQSRSAPKPTRVIRPRGRMIRSMKPAVEPTASQYITDVPELWGIGPDGSMMEAFNKFELNETQ